jgi:3-oxoacyl-[acyl-carrier protein] reductase
MITPIMLIRAVVDGMIARKFGRIVNVTSRSVKAPLPDLGLSNGARAGLTGFVAGLARQVAKHNVTINNLLPGPFETARTVDGLRKRSAKAGQEYEAFAAARRAEVPAGRRRC